MTPLLLVKRLSLPHLARAPLRSFLVVLGIALGVGMLMATRATSDALLRTFDDLVKRVADRADLVIAGNEAGIPAGLVAEATAIEGVAHAAPAVEITTSFAPDGEPLLILGVDFLGDTHFLPFRSGKAGSNPVEDPLVLANDPSALLVSRALAERRNLHVGAEVRLLGEGGVRTLFVRAILEESGPLASFGGQVAVMFLDAAQVTFGRGTLVDRIDVALDPHADKAKVIEKLRLALAGRARVELPQQIGQRMRALSEPLDVGMRLSGALALFVAIFIIYNAVGVAVVQRRRETGILRALGVMRRQVVAHFCLEASVLALLGVGLGVLLARLLVVFTHEETQIAVSRLYGTTPTVPAITSGNALRGCFAGLLVSLVAAYLPAWRGARLDPITALQASSAMASSQRVPHMRLAFAGVMMMFAATKTAESGSMLAGYSAAIVNLTGVALLVPLLLVLLRRALLPALSRLAGISGRLGLDNVERNLVRSTMNVLALMFAVSLSLGVSGWLESFEGAVRGWFEQVSAADLIVTAGSPLADRRRVHLASDTMQRLQGLPGIAEAQPVRMVEQRYGDKTFRLVASDTHAYLEQGRRRGKPWKVLQGKDPIEPAELRTAPRVVLAENAAVKLGLSAGDHMELQTPSGPVDLTVRAVVVDYSSDLGAGFIDRGLYVQRWSDSAIDAVDLYLEPGRSPAQVAKLVRERLGGGGALFVTETTALRDEFMRMADKSFSYTRALELIMLLIAATGVVGTMVAAVIDRTREIGLLRAVGATRAQVASAMVLEAGFLGVSAACAGVFAGSLTSALLLRTAFAHSSGWHVAFVFPTAGAVRICVLVVTAAALAGLAPGLRAARLVIRDALSSE
ncbi:MAG: FtsX-like permease family protein [Polyangiales bacterium]